MKHAMKKTLICILALLLAGGCRQEEEKQQAPLEKETAALAGILPSGDPATRTTLHEDGLLTTWESGDAIGVFGNNASNVRYTLSSGAGTPFGLFRGADSGSPVYAYYPFTEKAGDSYNAIKGTLAPETVQNGEETPIGASDWKVSSLILGNATDGYRIHFREIMALLSFTIDATGTGLEGETLRSVSLSAEGRKLAGNFTIDLSKADATPLFDAQASSGVVLKMEHRPVLAGGKPLVCHMFVNADVPGGTPLEIVLETNRSVSTTRVTAAKPMKAGHRYHIPLILEEISDKTTVTDIALKYDYQTFGIYQKGDTLLSYRAFNDQWSRLDYPDHYTFRIQNNEQKFVVSVEGIPQNPQTGVFYNISVSVYGTDRIAAGTRNVCAVRLQDHLLVLYDYENEISYVVYN
jgi:hypothetical protein